MKENGLVPSHEEWLSQREASKRFRIAPMTLRRRVRRGEIATYENPLDQRSMLFRLSDLEKLARPRLAPHRSETAASAA